MNDRVKSVLNSILQKFKNGDIPEAIAYSMFPFPDVPSDRGACSIGHDNSFMEQWTAGEFGSGIASIVM